MMADVPMADGEGGKFEVAEADTDRQCGRQRGATVSRDKTRVSVRSRQACKISYVLLLGHST